MLIVCTLILDHQTVLGQATGRNHFDGTLELENIGHGFGIGTVIAACGFDLFGGVFARCVFGVDRQ